MQILVWIMGYITSSKKRWIDEKRLERQSTKYSPEKSEVVWWWCRQGGVGGGYRNLYLKKLPGHMLGEGQEKKPVRRAGFKWVMSRLGLDLSQYWPGCRGGHYRPQRAATSWKKICRHISSRRRRLSRAGRARRGESGGRANKGFMQRKGRRGWSGETNTRPAVVVIYE